MSPNNQSGRRPSRRVQRTRKVSIDASALTEAKQQAILDVMNKYTRFGPKQVHAELRRTRHDISLDMVRVAFQHAGRKEGLLSRFLGR